MTKYIASSLAHIRLQSSLATLNASYSLGHMRNLAIYLAALATLSPGLGLRHGSRQLRDLLAFPKYQIDFLNDLPLSASDADRCKAVGVEVEDEFTQVRFEGRKGLGEGDGGRAKVGCEVYGCDCVG